MQEIQFSLLAKQQLPIVTHIAYLMSHGQVLTPYMGMYMYVYNLLILPPTHVHM